MSVEFDINQALTIDPYIAGVFGDRIFQGDVLPDGCPFPAILFKLVSDMPWMTLDGLSGLTKCRYQIDFWSKDALDVNLAAKHVRRRFATLRTNLVREVRPQLQALLWEDQQEVYHRVLDLMTICQEENDGD